ncbi:heterokaryon incompatibility protein-domain-containing protein [Cercophora newfieldiana]|uniref:Heterokaryon incompatibility protein-domain-containing protein n=1 Tax=Cercophora newfieldiana TaxID=92897 RepID=A0AA39XT15_9PEZI|nr:heterokaryon incompatibility protein-domain-containing protein [Cercophora newfieldiana]
MSVCDLCAAPFPEPNKVTEVGGYGSGINGLARLQDSAKSCHVCSLFLELVQEDKGKYKQLEESAIRKGHAKLRLSTEIDDENTKCTLRILTWNDTVDFTLHVPDELRNPHSDQAIWKNADTITFDQSRHVLRGWLKECNEEHGHCQKSRDNPTPRYPTRLIRIHPPPSSQLTLVKSAAELETLQHPIEYGTLSYCWGTGSGLRTTKSNLSQHLNSIPVEQLPLTVEQAIDVARAVGLQYLWIDRLCIVQDDVQDWRREAADMVNVYQNTWLTIAASFYFASDQLYWSCRHYFRSEDGLHDERRGETPKADPEQSPIDLRGSSERNHELWWRIVEQYSARVLSKKSDKFAALAGLTREFQKVLDSKPIGGMWMNDLHYGLDPTARPRIPGIPSWSWASIDGPVDRPAERNKRWAPRPRKHKQRWEDPFSEEAIPQGEPTMTWAPGEELTSPPAGGRLALKARLASCYWKPGPNRGFTQVWEESHSAGRRSAHGHLQAGCPGEREYFDSAVFFDATPFPSGLVWIMQTSISTVQHGNFNDFLIVEPVELEPPFNDLGFTHDEPLMNDLGFSHDDAGDREGLPPRRFRRIGVGYIHVWEGKDAFEGRELQDVILI